MPSNRMGDAVSLQKIIPRAEPSAERGLTAREARERLDNGYANTPPASAEKTVGQIFKDNILTYFNLVFFVLALLVTLVGSYKNLTFFPIIIANAAIGIIQELRAKRTLDRLRFMTEPTAVVIRDGEEQMVPTSDAVLDDVAVFSAGNQIYADAVVLTGECRVNEALVTGEPDEIIKQPGSALLSGSYVVSGTCRARLDKVGSDSFASRLTVEARKLTGKNRSVIIRTLTRLVQVIGFVIIPFGIALYLQQTVSLNRPVADSVVSTVAALIGMIPEGLYLLVSVALTVSVLRLAQKKTLVHDMGCIETLARVDVLCVDKTGTITENAMSVTDVVPIAEQLSEDAAALLLTDYAAAMEPDNETMRALRNRFNGQARRRAARVMAFSSEKKYSGVTFTNGDTLFLGAPEKLLINRYDDIRDAVEVHTAKGCRVLLLAKSGAPLNQKQLPEDMEPLALVVLANAIRAEAPATFRYFTQQGVAVKVISGDNPLTVSSVACAAGIPGAEQYIDASTLTTERKIRKAVREYTVFGRVTPDQKRKLIKAFKADGHTVAMTGDGVNDVLALKEADCSIAMASGSDAACHVSQLVLLDSNFAALPSVVAEGRRVINNITRSASLFLIKNIFSFMLTLTALLFALTYPITPSQLALFNPALIGIPSFVLALEPNTSHPRGRFLLTAFLRALPVGLTDFLALLGIITACSHYGIPAAELSTMATIVIGIVGFITLYRLCRPLNRLRAALIIAMLIFFCGGGLLLAPLFSLVPLSQTAIYITAVTAALSVPLLVVFTYLTGMITRALEAKH